MRAMVDMEIARAPTMSVVTGSWNAPRPVMMAMPWMMAMAALLHVSVRGAAVMASYSLFLRSATMGLPMPAVPATLTAPVSVLEQPAATVRHVLNWNSATMASPMLVVPATLIVARPEVARPVVTPASVRKQSSVMMVIRTLVVAATQTAAQPEAGQPVVMVRSVLN